MTTSLTSHTRLASLLLMFAAAAGAGCATTVAAAPREVHASATLAGAGPRMLVAGPAQILHVDVDGRGEVALYAVARVTGTDADCASAPMGARVPLRAGASNRIDRHVAADQVICAAAAGARAAILWHARRLDAAAGSPMEMLAMGDEAR